MAIIKCSSGAFEIRVQKKPYDAKPPLFFTEWANADDFHRERAAKGCVRYITPENSFFALEITLKKGFKYDDNFRGIRIEVVAIASKKKVLEKWYSKHYMEKEKFDFTEDVLFQIHSYHKEAVHSVPGKACVLSCDLFMEGVNGSEKEKPSYLEDGLRVKVYEGVSIVIGHSLPKYIKRERVFLDLHLRNDSYMKTNDMLESAETLEYKEWNKLSAFHQQVAFRRLQDHDKRLTLEQLQVAGGSETDPKDIEMKMKIENPMLWRTWSMLWKHEKAPIYLRLQERREFWDRGEIPAALPDPIVPEEDLSQTVGPRDESGESLPEVDDTHESFMTQKTAQLESLVSCAIEPQNTLDNGIVVAEPEIPLKESGKISFAPDVNASTTTTIKEELNNITSKPLSSSIIILDDSDEDSPQILFTNKCQAPKLNATEPMKVKNEPIDLDPNVSHSFSSQVSSKTEDERPVKRVKVESGARKASTADDSELQRLREEEEREEEELQAAQRVADLIRKRNERKLRMAALESRGSSTTG